MIWLVNTRGGMSAPYWIKADFKRNKRSYGVYIVAELHKFNVDKHCDVWSNIVYEKLPWEFLE